MLMSMSIPAPCGEAVAVGYLLFDHNWLPRAQRSEHRDPVQQLATNVASTRQPIGGGRVQQIIEFRVPQVGKDFVDPGGVRYPSDLARRRQWAADIQRQASARQHRDTEWRRPRGDGVVHHLPQSEAAPGERQRRHDATNEDRHDRHVHRWGEKVERHQDGVIDFELLRDPEVETLVDPVGADRAGESLVDSHCVVRHGWRTVVGTAGPVSHADAQERQVVQEEGIQVVRVEDDQDVWLDSVEVGFDLTEQLRRGMPRPLAGDLGR
jgi:hypothetical protein